MRKYKENLENWDKKDKESKYVLETFPNFIKEIKAKPELANNQNVWDNLMGELPKDQQFVIYGDDTVDFFTQSKFCPHNIASKEAFHRKHPYLTKQEAIKISTMEPTDQVMELKRLQTLRTTKHATGGRVPLALGKIVKGGNWLIKSLRGTREAIKNNKDYSPAQIKLFLKQIDDQIKNLEAGGKIPDEVIQTIRSDPKFKSVGQWQTERSVDPDLREMEEVLLEYGKKHASGGRVGMLFGGGVWKKIIQNLAKEKGISPSAYLAVTNWKHLPEGIKKIISKSQFEKIKKERIEMFENLVDMAKTRKVFSENIEQGKKTPAALAFEHLEKSFKSPVPHGVTDKDILQGEVILKNLKTGGKKGPELNASGGLAGMLGE